MYIYRRTHIYAHRHIDARTMVGMVSGAADRGTKQARTQERIIYPDERVLTDGSIDSFTGGANLIDDMGRTHP